MDRHGREARPDEASALPDETRMDPAAATTGRNAAGKRRIRLEAGSNPVDSHPRDAEGHFDLRLGFVSHVVARAIGHENSGSGGGFPGNPPHRFVSYDGSASSARSRSRIRSA